MFGVQARPLWRARQRQPLFSIRARMILLAVLAIAPLMVERVHGLREAREERTALALVQVMDLARSGAEAQRDTIYSMRALLQMVAEIYKRVPLGPAECEKTLADLAGNMRWLHGLSIAGTDGRITCATDSRAVGINIADRSYFQTALTKREFALSDYMINRVQHAPGLMATFPIVAADGKLTGVILASVNLDWVGTLAANAAQRSSASVVLIDGGGTLIAGSADQAAQSGVNYAGLGLVKDMLASDEGTTTGLDLNGVQRIFAFVRLPFTNAHLAVGVDEAAVRSEIDREISLTYLRLAGFGILILLIAWFAGEQLVVRPIHALVRTAARFGRGDLKARANERSWIAEFRPLATALDDMAAKLASREEELRIANQHLEELASLDGLTGLANRRGFDLALVHQWQQAANAKRPLTLMMVDIDHFKLFNDRHGHVSGDGCLRAVAETLSLATIREAVVVARYGGEEFALLMPGLDIAQAMDLAERARKAVEDLAIVHPDTPCGVVTVSIGVETAVPADHQSAAVLVEAADQALYDAKRRGRNRVASKLPMLRDAC
jgi:diguanylate cyclase (GGDEF)-like protein